MNPHLISAVIPVFNGARYLRDAIDSILAQTYQPIEVIIVDDGSTDATAEIARSYPGLRYIHQANQGHATAKNTGIAAARGELIGFLDADDIWEPNKISAQAAALFDDPRLGYAVCHMSFFGEPGVAWPAWLRPEFRNSPHPAWIPSALLARRGALDAVGWFDTAYWHTNDTDWFMRAREAGVGCAMLPGALLRRRLHESNLSHDMPALRSEAFRMFLNAAKRKRATGSETPHGK